MKSGPICHVAFLAILMAGCHPKQPITAATESNKENEPYEADKDSRPSSEILFSFAFVGCNRVDRGDRTNTQATNATSANMAVLTRIFDVTVHGVDKP